METDDFGGCGLTLRQLRCVLALVELRSFRRAGARLAVPARVLSREIAAIEDALGVRLFERQTRRTVPTALAVEVARAACRTLAERRAQTRDDVRGEAVLAVGWLDHGPGQAVQRAAIAEFRALYPHVSVQLAPASFRDQARATADGTLDVGFCASLTPTPPGIAADVLFAESVGSVLLPAGHPLADVDRPSLSDLGGLPLHTIRTRDAPEVVGGVLDAIARGGWHGGRTVGSPMPSQVTAMVACGAGWAPIPSSLLGWVPPGVVVRPLADGPLLGFDLCVLQRGADPLAAAFVGFMLELRDVIASPPEPTRARDRVGPYGYQAILTQRRAERARIARELHDTLLQDLIGSEMELDALRRRLPPALDAERATLQRVVGQLARAGHTGREAVRGLRAAPPSPRDLALTLSSVAEELREASPREFRMRTDGTPRELRPRVEEAAYRIGVEALTNAFRHAAAALVSVSLDYSADQFRLLVADDGRGIAPEVLHAGGRAGHFGLAGMRERAAEAGGALDVRSGPGAGSTVELVVPGHAAFAAAGR